MFNRINPSGNYMHHLLYYKASLNFDPLYIYVLRVCHQVISNIFPEEHV